MKRRDVIKGLGLSLGYVVATPGIVGMLQSCKTDANQWTPIFFTVDEGSVIRNLIDTMLPKTEATPGAIEVNVPEFLDLYASKVYTPEQQNKHKDRYSRNNKRIAWLTNQSLQIISRRF